MVFNVKVISGLSTSGVPILLKLIKPLSREGRTRVLESMSVGLRCQFEKLLETTFYSRMGRGRC